MVDPQASQFWQAALRSGLVDAKAMAECAEGVPPDRRTADAIDRRLARQAISLGHLTVWQAQQMLSGRSMGFKVDRYVLLDLLGQGGMGRVYLAKDTRLGRDVALKVLSRERMNNARAIARFHREVKVGAQLQHENLVRVYDEGQAQGIRYLVMEYIEGRNVAKLIAEEGPLPWPFAAKVGRGVALGLDHAFKKEFVHRDVNPSNILVVADGTAKLTDLGLAFDLNDEGSVTRDGATVGTFDYVAPEQAKNSHAVDTRADIYSLGCTLYHMIAGRPPFPMPSLPEKLYAHQSLAADPLRKLAPAVPEGLAAIVERMMRKSPKDRFQTPKDVADALEPYASGDLDDGAGATVDGSLVERARPIPPQPPRPTVDAEGESLELGLPTLDLGPAPGLTEGLLTSRSKPKSRSSSRSASDDSAKSATGRRWFVALVLIVLALLGAAMTLTLTGRWNPLGPDDAEKSPPDPTPTKPVADAGKTTVPAKPTPISVARRDGTTEPAPDFASAVNLALGGGGEVVLGDGEPLNLSTEPAIRIQRGPLVIRASEGAGPTLVVEDAGVRPLLDILGGASVTLRGLRIVARFPKKSAAPTPLFNAGGPIRIERCSIRARGEVAGSSLVKGQGFPVTIRNSLIDGFDHPLDLIAPPGCEATLADSIVARPRSDGDPLGWAIRLSHQAVGLGPNKDKPRRILVERCTFNVEGLLDVVDFRDGSPLTVEIRNSAVRSKSLVAWHASSGQRGAMNDKLLVWRGGSNRYDVSGDGWIVMSALASLPSPESPRNLAEWSARFKEADGSQRPFTFSVDPAAGPTTDVDPVPAAFGLKGEGVPKGLGADPAAVGPERTGPVER